MTRLKMVAALFALVALAACNDNSLPPGGTYQTVSGVVVDAATNKPVSGATVTIDTVLTATTDKDGKFTFAQVPVGDFDYVVSAQGYKSTASVPVHLEPDKPLTLNVTLSH